VRRILLVSVVGAIVARMTKGVSSFAAREVKAYESWQGISGHEEQ
jgi:hypothetical protein